VVVGRITSFGRRCVRHGESRRGKVRLRCGLGMRGVWRGSCTGTKCTFACGRLGGALTVGDRALFLLFHAAVDEDRFRRGSTHNSMLHICMTRKGSGFTWDRVECRSGRCCETLQNWGIGTGSSLLSSSSFTALGRCALLATHTRFCEAGERF
jgi:hypothetical protein